MGLIINFIPPKKNETSIDFMQKPTVLVDRGLLLPGMFPVPRSDIKVVKNGVLFQKYCYNGMPYDVAISWLQKAIRLGYEDEALHCAWQVYKLGKIFRSHLLNRLITIASEDIGPAERGLFVPLSELYLETKRLNNQGQDTCKNITIMVCALVRARKSRITDLLYHKAETGDPPGVLEDQYELVVRAISLMKDGTPGPVTLEYNGTTRIMTKPIFRIWKDLLVAGPEVVALMEVFIHQPDILHLIHAILIAYSGDVVESTILPECPSPSLVFGNDEIKYPILNRSIDMHTYWGRKYLGRGMHDFIYYGSVVNNAYPQPGEEELISYFRKMYPPREQSTASIRDYQEEIAVRSEQFFISRDEAWVVMACGTGKTKTAFWIYDRMNPGYSIVVLPFLEILKQFVTVWSEMFSGKTHHCAVMASTRKDFKMSEATSFSYIGSVGDFKIFSLLKGGRKIIFTTYASLRTLLKWKPDVDLVIYDEAHHYKPHHRTGRKRLFLTATPSGGTALPEDTLGFYHMSQAIGDGHLSDYRVHILDPLEDPSDHLDRVFRVGNKVIVYASYVATAMELMSLVEDSKHSCHTITAKTDQTKRKAIFSEFLDSGNKCAIFNCATLGEGVDLPSCDAIYINSGYNSPQRVVQAFGRALRPHKDKAMAHIFIVGDKNHKKKLDAMLTYDPGVYSKVVELED